MKKIFNNETCPSRLSLDVPAIYVSANNLNFNIHAVKHIGLKAGDKVTFEQEGDTFSMRLDPHEGIPVRNAFKNCLKIGRASLRQALHRAVGHPRFRFEIGDRVLSGRYPLTLVAYDKK